MVNLPVLLNGDFSKIVGFISLEPALIEYYKKQTHLTINPIINKPFIGAPEVVGFGIYPAQPEFEPPPRKRGRPKKIQSE